MYKYTDVSLQPVAGSSETAVQFYQATQQRIPDAMNVIHGHTFTNGARTTNLDIPLPSPYLHPVNSRATRTIDTEHEERP
jgi:hypothetical protein